DFLRVFGAFAVIVIHVASQNWYKTDVHSLEWQAMNFWHGSIVRWAVPIFTMISGALFLSRDIPLKKIYGKYIFRIITALLFWSFAYASAYYIAKREILHSIGNFLTGHYHLWFLSMIVGLYALQPFLKKIANSESLTKYFLVIAFFFTFLFPEIVEIISLFSEKYGKFANGLANRFQLHFVAGYTSYFLLGHLLNNSKISPKAERIIYVLGVIGVIAGLFLSIRASIITNKPNQTFYGNFTVNTLLESVAVFVFFKAKFNWPSKIIRTLSQYSFGAYLVHDAVRLLLSKLGLHSLTFSPVVSIPVISAIVFVISFTISAVLNRVPVLRKYIV
ncbi:MAG: acyltransferase family protein, partial [Synergistaceae bacterium]|nr:acyltransferase family protein [Synergistaceae bacterium]